MGWLWDDRVVQLWAGQKSGKGSGGSGVAIGKRGILTARHTVVDTDTQVWKPRILARIVRPGLKSAWVPAAIVAEDNDWDLAVLEVAHDLRWPVLKSKSPKVAVLDGRARHNCESVGFPVDGSREIVIEDLRKRVYPTTQLWGTLMPSGNVEPISGIRDSVSRAINFDTSGSTPDGQDGWGGMSGAGVVLENGELAGIVSAADARHQQRQLKVVPLDTALKQSDVLRDAVETLVGATPVVRSRACFISSEYPPHIVGGLGIYIGAISEALASEIDLDVVLPNILPGEARYDKPTTPGLRLQRLRVDNYPTYEDAISWLQFSEEASDKIDDLIKDGAVFNVIHCHDWTTALAGLKCRNRHKIPLVFHLHLPESHPFCRAIETLALACSDVVVVCSEAMRAELKKRVRAYKIPFHNNIQLVKNGVDVDTFRPAEDEESSDDGYILYAGRLVRQKGVEYLLRALPYVNEKFPGTPLKIVGDGRLRNALEKLRDCLLLPKEQVEFLGHVTSRAELAKLYQQASVVVVPSIYEPFGMTALEAMACGRPVIASRVGGLEELVGSDEYRETGFLAEPRDELGIAQWLMALLSDRERRIRVGMAGCQSLRAEWAWPSRANNLLDVYATLDPTAISDTYPKRVEDRLGGMREEIKKEVRALELNADESIKECLDRLLDWKSQS